jgi:hypothetical protein
MRRDNYDPDNATEGEVPDHTAPSGQVAAGPATSSMRGTESDIQQQAEEVAGQAQSRTTQVKDKALEQADVGRHKAASGLHSAADSVRKRAGEGEGTTQQFASKASDAIDKSANYLDDKEPKQMWEDFQKYVKDHPVASAAGALVAGLIVGRIVL